jgi:uncharacterized protein YdaU (DUF1376 family)
MAKRRRWIMFYIDDYHADTAALSFEEHAAYILLLHECWRTGAIPMDRKRQAGLLKISLFRMQGLWPAIAKFFEADGTNKRATKERAKAEAVSVRRSISGQIGGWKSANTRAIAAELSKKAQANWQANRQAKQVGLLGFCSSSYKKERKKETTVTVEEGAVDNLPVPALATALCDGALAPGPVTQPASPKRSADKKTTGGAA